MATLDDALKKAARTGKLNAETGINFTKATNFSEKTAQKADPGFLSSGGIPANYSRTSETIANNPELSEMFSDDRDFLLDYGVSDRYREDWFHNFSRYGFIDPYHSHKKTKEYLFFTRPDLHIFEASGIINPELSSSSSLFTDAVSRYQNVAELLQYTHFENQGPLVPLLSNAVNSSLDLPSISADYVETAKNVYGTSLNYRGSSFKSDIDFDFSLDFRDSKFLDVYMYFKMYDEYERLKWMGQVSPPSMEYIKRKVLHDQTSIYKFIVAEDGMSLIYFARAVGVTPNTVPRESISNIDGELTISVGFKAHFIYDMDPRILTDFNRITASYRSNMVNLPLYDSENHINNGTWAGCPVIVPRKSLNSDAQKRHKYSLMWVK